LGATEQMEFNNSSAIIPNYESVLDSAIDDSMNQMREGYPDDIRDSSVVAGWTYANTLSFLEGGVYGQDYADSPEAAQAETLRESNLHREGALFGLELAGTTPPDGLVWYVPTAGSVEMPDGVGGALDVLTGNVGTDLESDTNVILNPDGTTFEPAEDGDVENDGDGGRR
jgi:hypothetical protein